MLILKDRDQFRDNWIYIHDPSVKVGRVQNFKSWSPEMVPDPGLNCYGLEYFCFEGDGLWASSDADLIALAKRELAQIGLAAAVDVLDGCVVRQAKAYPVYDDRYAEHVEVIRRELEANYPRLHLVGRNGMHKYNNQDHAMMTAMLCVENITAGQPVYDLWRVNQDAEYHEAGGAGAQAGATGLRTVPTRIEPGELAAAGRDGRAEMSTVRPSVNPARLRRPFGRGARIHPGRHRPGSHAGPYRVRLPGERFSSDGGRLRGAVAMGQPLVRTHCQPGLSRGSAGGA